MRKLLCSIVMLSVFTIMTACAAPSKDITIKPLEDSDYVHTFQELHLGHIWDFDFYLPKADQRTVQLWVEKYSDGQKDEQFEVGLSYGMSPSKAEKGHIGFGLLDGDTRSLFFYAPGVKGKPQTLENLRLDEGMSTGQYAFTKEQKLELNTEYIVGAYRQSLNNSMRSGYDFTSAEEVQQLIDDDTNVLLFKIKITESE
ncbi:hypothetical protein [Metasolibacillus meyeri]|uniref:hypothetical protein n=1 Tax=Metasolibacillus meyeri TaxID=1071052 RepID=UPI000D307EC4|nr:hypothetical protein [Metasolibacillus meyeri]